jgi:hypothetical protein
MRKTTKSKKVRQARKLSVGCGGCCNSDVIDSATIAEAVARAFPGMSVSIETISEAEALRRLAEGGNLFRGGLL